MLRRYVERQSVEDYMKERAHQVAQAQVTALSASTVQYCTPCSPNPDLPSDACVILKEGEYEGKMGLEQKRGELKPSAGTDIGSLGQQSTPKRGTWEVELINAGGNVHVGMSSAPGGDNSSPPERSKRTSTFADILSTATTARVAAREEATIGQHGQGTASTDEDKQFDPGGKMTIFQLAERREATRRSPEREHPLDFQPREDSEYHHYCFWFDESH